MRVRAGQVLRLRRGLTLYEFPDGTFELASPRERWALRLRAAVPAAMRAALDALFEGLPSSEAAAGLAHRSALSARQAQRLVDDLQARGALVVDDRTSDRGDGVDDLYDRQIRFLEAFETAATDGRELHERLRRRTVALVGLGGGGSWIALQCARVGIRRIVGIDDDVVELSNLNRQVLYERRDVGLRKTERSVRALTGADPEIEVITHDRWIRSPEDLVPLLRGVDLLFNPFAYQTVETDPDGTGESIARAGLAAGVPTLAVGGSWIGPLTVPGVTACLGCVAAVLDLDYLRSISRQRIFQHSGAFAPRQVISAGVTVWEACRFLSGMDRAPSLDGVIVLDTFNYAAHALQPVPRDPNCPWCGGIAAVAGRNGSGEWR
jgi:molybdopterin-synthase adenylyltransferase